MCDCDLCRRLRTTKDRIAELPEDKQEFFENMVIYMLEVEFDNDYYKAIMSGKWPGGKEALQAALAKYPTDVPPPPSPPPARIV